MKFLVEKFGAAFPAAVILGHRDFSPDKNRNGIIEPSEWMKSCPSFSVKDWLKKIGYKSKAPKTYMETTTRVNIRTGAGIKFTKAAPSLVKNTLVQRIAEADGWTYVQLQDKSQLLGWISSEYLRLKQ